MKSSRLARISTIVGLAIGGFALSAIAAGSWTPPGSGCTPPSCNIDTPINTGAQTQTKTGLLALVQLIFNPTGTLGSVPAGSVLVSSDTNGVAKWETYVKGTIAGGCSVGNPINTYLNRWGVAGSGSGPFAKCATGSDSDDGLSGYRRQVNGLDVGSSIFYIKN